MIFTEMLREVRAGLGLQQQELAAKLDISTQYLCDLEKGRRMPSVALVERICVFLGRGSKGSAEWHLAGARAHGWKV